MRNETTPTKPTNNRYRYSVVKKEREGDEQVKRHTGGAGTLTGHTRGARAQTGTRITQTNLTTIPTHQRTHTMPHARPHDDRNLDETAADSTAARQPRSRPLPAVDSEEAAPSDPTLPLPPPPPRAPPARALTPAVLTPVLEGGTNARRSAKSVSEMKARAAAYRKIEDTGRRYPGSPQPFKFT
jgi:hypothetical protein